MRDEIAILMAAGLGTRMRPLTETTPKPLIQVRGRPMIETVIGGLRRRGVGKIYVVVGYLGEQFVHLAQRFPEIAIVENREYLKKNNISSVHAVCDVLERAPGGCFLCEADLFVADQTIFDAPLTKSCYFGKLVRGHSDDWVFEQDADGRITRVGKGGDDVYNMVGVSYFLREDARILAAAIRETCAAPGHEALFWDEVVDQNLDRLRMTVHTVRPEQIVEIDTPAELAEVERQYGERKL